MSVLLGGEYWPVGDSVGFLELPFRDAVRATLDWGRAEQFTHETLPLQPVRDCVLRLLPLQTPPGKELILPAGPDWTAYVTNDHAGGDPGSWVRHLARQNNCRGVVASHSAPGTTPWPATQFHLLGPTGRPPLMYVRTVDAGIFDSGRWSFDVSGEPQPFEETEAYKKRLKRDRFTRPMLLRYLSALGIRANHGDVFRGSGLLLESTSDYPRRVSSLGEAREEAFRTTSGTELREGVVPSSRGHRLLESDT